MERLGAGRVALLGRAAAQAVVVAAPGAHRGLRRAHVTCVRATKQEESTKEKGWKCGLSPWKMDENAGLNGI